MSSTRIYQRLKPRLRKLLQSQFWDLDFGLFRILNRRRVESERFLETELPQIVSARAGSPTNERDIYEVLGLFADDCSSAELPLHVHCTSPLPQYAFRLPSGRRVVFQRVESAGEGAPQAGNGQPTKETLPNRFTLAERRPWPHRRGELCLHFEFRPTTWQTKQKHLNQRACSAILAAQSLADWQAELSQPQTDARGSRLEHHLAQFTTWHDRDLVIRRNVTAEFEGRLERVIFDRWLAPAIRSAATDQQVSSAVGLARLTREIGCRLIAWAAQREQALEQLWQRAPRIARAEYCVTLDRIPRQLWPTIAANSRQRLAWHELFGVHLPAEDACEEFLAAHPSLVVDTQYFDRDFREHLLASFENLDAATDGVLVQGDNSAALRLLGPRYAGTVRCAFIDPPYNTGSGVWAYADRFQHSLWEAMMRDRLTLARELLSRNGAIFVSLDDHEQARLRLLMDEVFGEQNFLATLVWEKVHTRKNSARHFSVSHDYIPAFAKDKSLWERHLLPRTGTADYENPDGDPRGLWKPDPIYANKPYAAAYQVRKPNGVVLDPPAGRYWRFSEANLLAKAARKELLWGEGDSYPLAKRYLDDVQAGLVPVTLFRREFAGDNALANAELAALFGGGRAVSYPKPSRLIERIGQIATRPAGDDIVLDFFAGSGTTGQAVINLNRADGGRRKYLLVEKEDYFESVLVPRVAKSVYSDRWQAGRPLAGQGVGQLFKCLRLESFEAALCRSGSDEPEESNARVDLLETLICRIGLRVERQQRIAEAVVVRGKLAAGQNVLILWTDELLAGPAKGFAKVAAAIRLSNQKWARVYVRRPAAWPHSKLAELADEICDIEVEYSNAEDSDAELARLDPELDCASLLDELPSARQRGVRREE